MADTPRLGRRPRFLLLTILVALLCDRAPAQTVLYWNSTNGASGGNWSNTNNWVGSVTPTNGDTLVFTQGSGTLNNDLSALTLNEIIFANSNGSWTVSGLAVSVTNNIVQSGSGVSNIWNAPLSLTASNLTLNIPGNSTLTISGLVSGPGGLTLAGPGTVILSNANTYTGPTRALFGSLALNSNQPQSSVTVGPNGTLTGVGTLGNLFCSGTLVPGSGFAQGALTCSNLTMTPTAVFNPGLLCSVTGSVSSRLNVLGTISLDNARLQVGVAFSSLNAPPPGQLVVIQNNGGSSISGNFSGGPDGAPVTVFNAEPNLYAEQWEVAQFHPVVNYTLGGANDVTLRPQQAALYQNPSITNPVITGGDGTPGLQPNGCYNFSVILQGAGVPLTGVSAVLSSATPGVIVTQPYSAFPNLFGGQSAQNVTPFEVSTLPSLACGAPVELELSLTSSVGPDIVPINLRAGQTSASPYAFIGSPFLTIPQNGVVSTAITIPGALSNILNATVTANITYQNDAHLTLTLVSPNGTAYVLANGPDLPSGANFNGTTFDDAATSPIYFASPPFAGAYQPETPLTSLAGAIAPGTWTLQISATNGVSTGSLNSWSLAFYPSACSGGSGSCGYCQPAIAGTINGSNPTTIGLTPNGIASAFAQPKAFPGATITNAHYQTYVFTNTLPQAACIGVELDSTSEPLLAGAYLNSFNPTNAALNYLGDAGVPAAANAPGTFSVNVPAGLVFVIVVSEINPGSGGGYTLNLSGLPCPAPTLQAQAQSGTNAVISWSTSAGGFLLEATPSLPAQGWTPVTNDPISSGGFFRVTNSTANSPSLFYRLYQP